MEAIIIDYINISISDLTLKNHLITLISSTKINDKLLCLCILIDLKYTNLNEADFTPIFSARSLTSADDFESLKHVCLCSKISEKKMYSRVVKKEKHDRCFGTTKYDSISDTFTVEFDEKKIKDTGWLGYLGEEKDFVWITLHDEMSSIINHSSGDPYKSNKACDFVGLARNYRKTSSPRKPNPVEFVLIIYSEDFPDDVYQPNCTNADWSYKNTLFICYNNSDGFGRTYNENGVKFKDEYGKERIHQNSFYFDEKFDGLYIGNACHENLIRKGILAEAVKRLDI